MAPSGRSASPAERLLSALIVVLALAYLTASFQPSVGNWGFHALAFGPWYLRWIIPGVMLLLAFPRVQTAGVAGLRCAVAGFAGVRRPIRVLIAVSSAALLAACFFLFSSAGITGDGQFLIHNMFQIGKPSDIAHVFLHEPLTCLIQWMVARGLGPELTPSATALAYRLTSVACGIAFLPVLAAVIRRIVPGRTERVLAFLFVLGSGSSLLFFGHIENYTIAYLVLLVFILSAMKYSAGETGLVAPSVAAGVLIPLYFGMLCILPALAWLYIAEAKKTGSPGRLVLPAIAFLGVSLGLLLSTGFTPGRFAVMLNSGGGHLIGVFRPAEPMTGEYTLLSGRHLGDLANFALFISPFCPFLLLIPFVRRSGARRSSRPVPAWLFLLAGSCGAVIVLFQCILGMPRDWDLLSPYVLGLLILSLAWFVHRVPAGEGRRNILFGSASVLLLHLLPWVALYHLPQKAVAQSRMVIEQSTWIGGMYKGFEILAMSAKGRGEYDSAAVFYREFLKGDPDHDRILGNLAEVYRTMGLEDSQMVYAERAVARGSTVSALYFNLGILYADRGRYDDAIRVMERGLRLDPGRADILNNIGAFILRARSDCAAAMPYFSEALRADPAYALAYLNAGECSQVMGDTVSMKYYFSRYMKLDPAQAVRMGIPARLREGSARR